MVLAGRRGKRRVLFIFGTQYCEFLPVVQKSAPGSSLRLFIPTQCRTVSYGAPSSRCANTRQIKFQKT
jgi:hypothetical protein